MDTIVRRGSNSENGCEVCLFILCLKFSRVVGFFRNQRQAGMGGRGSSAPSTEGVVGPQQEVLSHPVPTLYKEPRHLFLLFSTELAALPNQPSWLLAWLACVLF